jgi:hypothetical protein
VLVLDLPRSRLGGKKKKKKKRRFCGVFVAEEHSENWIHLYPLTG